MKKRLLSVIMAMLMLIITAQNVFFMNVFAETIISADADGVFWIEESDYDTHSNAADGVLSTRVGVNGTAQATADMMSGGDAYWAWWSGAKYSVTYKVNAQKAGTYKLWYRGSDPEGPYHDKSIIKVNGEEVTVTKVVGSDFIATIDPSGTRKNFACGWYITEVEIASGKNVISYEVLEKSSVGQKYACLFDCMVLAPSTYVWENPTIDTYPAVDGGTGEEPDVPEIPDEPEAENSFDENGVAKFEESEAELVCNTVESNYVLSLRVGTNGTPQELVDSMSNGDAHWLKSGGVTYSATYKVNAPEAGTYKLWYRGSDPTGPYHDKSVIKVNGTVTNVTKVVGTDFLATIDPSGTVKNYACGWFLAEVALNAGENTITYEVMEKSTSDPKYSFVFDCMVLAPSTYVWENPTIDTHPAVDDGTGEEPDVPEVPEEPEIPDEPEIPEEPEVESSFDKNGVAKFEESDYDTYSNSADGILSTRVGVNGTAQELVDSMSGGDAYWAWWSGVKYSATYKVNAPEAGTYKLWYRGSDSTGPYHDKSVVKVNGEVVSVAKVVGTDFVATIDPSGTVKNYACGWFLAEVTLDYGENVVSYEVNEKSSGGDKYAFLFDCMVIAPSTYDWDNPTIDTLPTLSEDVTTMVSNFKINGTVEAGQIVTATASMKRIDGGEGKVNLILAVYDEDNKMIAMDICQKVVADGKENFECSVTIGEEHIGNLHAKAFMWSDFAKVEPIVSGISTLQ